MFDLDRWEEIWVTITRNKTRSLLTGLGVFWGVFLLVLLIGSGNGMQNGIYKNVDGFATNSAVFFTNRTTEVYKGYKKGRSWSMRNRDLQTIRTHVRGIKYLSPISIVWAGMNNAVRSQKAGSYNIRGVHPEYFEIETQHLLKGRFLNEIDIQEKRKVCLIGSIVEEVLFEESENPLGEYIRVNGIYYQVVGVISPKPKIQVGGRTEETIMLPFSTLQQTFNQGDKFNFLAVTAEDGYNCDTMVEDITTILKSQNNISITDSQAVGHITIARQFERFNILFKGMDVLVWFVGLGTLLAGIIGVSNIMMVTVRERTREIGVRRAIGATPFNIMNQILSESITLTVLTGLTGLSAGVVVLDIAEKWIENNMETDYFFFYNPEIRIETAIIASIIILVSGMFAGLIPTWRALQIKAIDAIRDE